MKWWNIYVYTEYSKFLEKLHQVRKCEKNQIFIDDYFQTRSQWLKINEILILIRRSDLNIFIKKNNIYNIDILLRPFIIIDNMKRNNIKEKCTYCWKNANWNKICEECFERNYEANQENI